MSKPITIYDEYAAPWLVYEEDPAGPLVKTLAKLNLTLIVLPRESIITGELRDVAPPTFPDSLPDSLDKVVIHQTRLYDCVQHLQRGGGDSLLVP